MLKNNYGNISTVSEINIDWILNNGKSHENKCFMTNFGWIVMSLFCVSVSASLV